MDAGDPIRIFTVIAAAAALWQIRRVAAAIPEIRRCIFHFTLWLGNVISFYLVYLLTNRWQPPWDALQKYWPALLVAHAAVAIFLALQSMLMKTKRNSE